MVEYSVLVAKLEFAKTERYINVFKRLVQLRVCWLSGQGEGYDERREEQRREQLCSTAKRASNVKWISFLIAPPRESFPSVNT